MNIFYLANQVYQLSYAKPIYKKLGGAFLVSNYRKLVKFKWQLRKLDATDNQISVSTNSKIVKKNIKNLSNFNGVIISQSNTRIISHDSNIKTIFVGHGTGDKKYGGNPEILLSYDYHFISGPKHLAKLYDVGINIPKDCLISIGNPRFDYYLNIKEKTKYLNYLGVKDLSLPTVLYAPTWKWGGGTLRKLVYKLSKKLSGRFNLIIRPHHFDIHLIPWLRLWVILEGLENIYFSNPNNILNEDTMDVFASSDILVSDTSSLIYEYLITGKPIIRVKTEDEQDLHNMPTEMTIIGKSDVLDPDNLDLIIDKIELNLNDRPYKKIYQKMLSDCFYFNDGSSTKRAIDFISSIN
tara:strand:+ start:647 stop:1702 length:1056 start_codon:yes stop_codon:yes gene_type:complete